jgi:hypothetical protein
MRRFGSWLLAVLIPLTLSAARLTLRDGTVVNGRFVSGSARIIVFQDDHGVGRQFDVDRVQDLEFNNNGNVNPYERDRDAVPYREQPRSNYRDSPGLDARNIYAVLPVGTEVSVRTNEEINAQSAVEGRTYSAAIDRDVLDESGRIVIPRGSKAEMVIRNVREGGTFTSGDLVLDLESVQVDGRHYLVNTADISRGGNQGLGKNRRTGELVGGGAVLGTVIGAVAGGGKGALIGALAGAAGGGAVQVLTKGKEIRVPAETQLNFRLDQPLQLNETR